MQPRKLFSSPSTPQNKPPSLNVYGITNTNTFMYENNHKPGAISSQTPPSLYGVEFYQEKKTNNKEITYAISVASEYQGRQMANPKKHSVSI
jgi:hypothetical protein